jgi:diguanylate cyclase (GGDEF)-like protein
MSTGQQLLAPHDIETVLFHSLDVIPIPALVSCSDPVMEGKRHHLFINKAFVTQLGYTTEDMPDMLSWFRLAYPDPVYRQQIIREWQQAVEDSMARGEKVAEMSALVRCKNGQRRWFIVAAQISAEVMPAWHIVTFRDVHDLHCMVEENRRLSITDPLTRLANRREAQMQLELARNAFLQRDQPFSVLLGDVDHFKALNDRFGHSCGDEALCLLAATLQSCARQGDCVARWGGEEFLLLLPATNLEGALATAQRIRSQVAQVALPWDNAPTITMSIGCATMTPELTLDSLIQQADQALYRAKAAGRNCVMS